MIDQNSHHTDLSPTPNEIFIDEFEHDDLVFFSNKSGIAINISKGRALIFEYSLDKWIYEEHKLSNIRNAQENAPTAEHHYTIVRSGGVKGIGQEIGIAARNASAKNKVRKETGVIIKLRSTSLPSFFIHIEDVSRRNSFMEAMRQILEDGAMDEPFRCIPLSIKQTFCRPTEAQLAVKRTLELKQKRWKVALHFHLKDYGIMCAIVFIEFILLLSFNYIQLPFRGGASYVTFFLGSILGPLFVLLPVTYILIKAWKATKFLVTPK